ncbi:uncharacterized protein V6R79_020890 [Siganus canaliculatus]
MLITLCYVYLWVRFHKCYSMLIRNRLTRLSSSSFSFSVCSKSSSTAQTPGRRPPSPDPDDNSVFLQLGDKAVFVTKPQACDDLSKWTVLLGSSLICGPRVEVVSFIIEATGHRVGCCSPHTSHKKVLKWSDYCLPLACSPGLPFRAVAQASVDNFSRLGVAFIEDRLHLDDGLVPSKIIPVLIQESTISQLFGKHSSQTDILPRPCETHNQKGATQPLPCHQLVKDPHLQYRKGSLLHIPEANSSRLVDRRGSEPLCYSQDRHSVLDHSSGNHMEDHGQHLHLSSCHECLELENSTILSVKHASAENIPDLPHDSFPELDSEDNTVNVVEQQDRALFGRSTKITNKPPNILVFTGGSQDRFQEVYKLLSECINMEDNILYPLLPQQALCDPWMDNTKLLVLAEKEILNPQLQNCFLTYLNQGGRVLGLASTLCPAGLSLEVREGQHKQVSRLSFTREDSTELELTVLASGMTYIRDTLGGGEVELWGELVHDGPNQRDMVIVRVTHEGDGGEAVLCQVHLETAPHSQNLSSECFDELKVSNALRYEVLTEILTSLGLNCEPSQTLSPSPLYLLATSQEFKTNFLNWLQKRADQNGYLKLSKSSFRMVSSSELKDGPLLDDDNFAVINDSSVSQSWPHFSMETYNKNLKTRVLGHTMLYAEVITSTMDVMEGLWNWSEKFW